MKMKAIEINRLHPLAVNATKELRRLGFLKPGATESDWTAVASVIQTVCRLNGLCLIAIGNTEEGWDILNQMGVKLHENNGLEIGLVNLEIKIEDPRKN